MHFLKSYHLKCDTSFFALKKNRLNYVIGHSAKSSALRSINIIPSESLFNSALNVKILGK